MLLQVLPADVPGSVHNLGPTRRLGRLLLGGGGFLLLSVPLHGGVAFPKRHLSLGLLWTHAGRRHEVHRWRGLTNLATAGAALAVLAHDSGVQLAQIDLAGWIRQARRSQQRW